MGPMDVPHLVLCQRDGRSGVFLPLPVVARDARDAGGVVSASNVIQAFLPVIQGRSDRLLSYTDRNVCFTADTCD